MNHYTRNPNTGEQASSKAEHKPQALAQQLIAAVEAFGVQDTAAAFRESRERRERGESK